MKQYEMDKLNLVNLLSHVKQCFSVILCRLLSHLAFGSLFKQFLLLFVNDDRNLMAFFVYYYDIFISGVWTKKVCCNWQLVKDMHMK